MGHLFHPGGSGGARLGPTCLVGAGMAARGCQRLSVPITRARLQLWPLPHSFGWPGWPHLLACMAGGRLAPGSLWPHSLNCPIPVPALSGIQTILNRGTKLSTRLGCGHRALVASVSVLPGAAQPHLFQEAFSDCSILRTSFFFFLSLNNVFSSTPEWEGSLLDFY